MLETLARTIIIAGMVLILVGGGLLLFARLGMPLGSVPGDIRLEKGNTTCVIALGTSVLLSILLTVVLNLLARWLSR